MAFFWRLILFSWSLCIPAAVNKTGKTVGIFHTQEPVDTSYVDLHHPRRSALIFVRSALVIILLARSVINMSVMKIWYNSRTHAVPVFSWVTQFPLTVQKHVGWLIVYALG